MDKQQYQQIRNYQEKRQLFFQMELESLARNLTHKIEKFQITENTVPTILQQELEQLQHRIKLLMQQLKTDL